jgi:DNA primase
MNAIDLNRSIDLSALVGTKLRKSGKFLIGPCPLCGGKDRFNIKFTEHGQRWFCRHCGDGKYHSAIDFIMRRDNIDFKTALERLGGDPFIAAAKPVEHIPDPTPAPPADWQHQAEQIIKVCRANLTLSSKGEKAFRWLNARGITDKVIDLWQLGYSAGQYIAGIWVERGITIPCMDCDTVVRYIKIRRPAGDPKYRKLKGSQSGVFGLHNVLSANTVILTEGEFDAMLLDHAIWENSEIGVATFGSSTDRLDPVTYGWAFQRAQRIIAAYDIDAAGLSGQTALSLISGKVTRAEIPQGKDITDYWKAGGDLAAWVQFQMEVHLG